MYDKKLIDMSNRIQYYRKNPSLFAEDICGIKLTKWQRYIIDNIGKVNIQYNDYNSYKKYKTYTNLCLTYIFMKDDEYIAIVSPDKVERLNKDGLLKYLKKYWDK